MTRQFALACVVALGTALTVAANEKPTADFQNAMKSNGAAAQALRTHLMARDRDAASYDAYTIRTNMAKIEAYWTEKKVDDAVAFAKAVGKAALDLEMAATAMDDTRMGTASTAITAACGSCHMAHRVRLPDMSFEIK